MAHPKWVQGFRVCLYIVCEYAYANVLRVCVCMCVWCLPMAGRFQLTLIQFVCAPLGAA